jgi:hypothetical protein
LTCLQTKCSQFLTPTINLATVISAKIVRKTISATYFILSLASTPKQGDAGQATVSCE